MRITKKALKRLEKSSSYEGKKQLKNLRAFAKSYKPEDLDSRRTGWIQNETQREEYERSIANLEKTERRLGIEP